MLKIIMLSLVLMAAAVPGCKKSSPENKPPPAAKSSLPVILVDLEHLQVKRADGTTPPYYVIPAGDGFSIDASALPSVLPAGIEFTEPDAIKVIVNNQQYSIPWVKGQSMYSVSAQTLTPMAGASAFTGLKAGTQVVIAIGHVGQGKAAGANGTFEPMWGGIATVQ